MGSLGSKLVFLCAGFGLAFATMATAQSYDPDYGGGNVGVAYMVQPDGSTSRFGGAHATVNATGDKALMGYAQDVPTGSILYRKNGKLHMIKGQMVEGKPMREWEKTWTQ